MNIFHLRFLTYLLYQVVCVLTASIISAVWVSRCPAPHLLAFLRINKFWCRAEIVAGDISWGHRCHSYSRFASPWCYVPMQCRVGWEDPHTKTYFCLRFFWLGALAVETRIKIDFSNILMIKNQFPSSSTPQQQHSHTRAEHEIDNGGVPW